MQFCLGLPPGNTPCPKLNTCLPWRTPSIKISSTTLAIVFVSPRINKRIKGSPVLFGVTPLSLVPQESFASLRRLHQGGNLAQVETRWSVPTPFIATAN